MHSEYEDEGFLNSLGNRRLRFWQSVAGQPRGLKKLSAYFRRLFSKPKALDRRRFVVDGTNVALLHGAAYPELRYVLAVCDYLTANGGEFDCFFDANTRYVLKDHRADQLEVFDQITRKRPLSTRFHVVPSGTEADQWILTKAKSDGSDVISNDRFRDRAKNHRWIWKRRHSVRIKDGYLMLSSLEAVITVLPRAEEYLR